VGIGVSIFLFAVGAILTFAVDVTTRGIDINTIGVILMLVGAIGLLASLVFWSDWAPRAAGGRRTSSVVYDDVDMADDVYAGGPRAIVEAPARRRRTVYRRHDVS
jgi:hypothetical protein